MSELLTFAADILLPITAPTVKVGAVMLKGCFRVSSVSYAVSFEQDAS